MNRNIYSAFVLVISMILVHLIYVAWINPNVEIIQNIAAQTGSILPRNLFIIIKDFEQKISGEVVSYLRQNKRFERKNVQVFRQELADIGAVSPTLIAFGTPTYKILEKNFKDEFKILKIRHYAYRENKEDYREHVKKIW